MVKSLPAMRETQVQTLGREDLMNGGAWGVTLHGVTKNQTRLSDFTHFPESEEELKSLLMKVKEESKKLA